MIDDWSIHDVQNELQSLIVEDQHLTRLASKSCLQHLQHHQVYLWVRRVFEQPFQHQCDVFAHILAFVLQVPAKELVDIVSVFGECAVKVHVSEDEAHVEQAEVLAEDVVGHVRCDEWALQSLLAYMAPDLHVLVRDHSIIDHQEPHAEVLEWIDSASLLVHLIILLDEIIEDAYPVPNCL